MSESQQDLNRREWMRTTLQVMAALGLASRLSMGEGEWQPEFFTPQQNEQLVSLGECILPGSKAALSTLR